MTGSLSGLAPMAMLSLRSWLPRWRVHHASANPCSFLIFSSWIRFSLTLKTSSGMSSVH
eukprot:CAMPEP_0174708034 /NCGR_PEP_ID=MMETSP1094-20130205/10393_1 /TAXON_ID=156173 /ORGANISM="Chrysochromulina brevifilum, Strain UTEX LB 985" /LENGTH=58 /DNA_ID=CAMNT_0015906523 /DNA_START=542 /DNA_END=721 /DNA_ORIENTATION=-